MENITISLETVEAIGLAISTGWTPTIEDTNAEMVGDEYPTIPNTLTYQKHLQVLIPGFITEKLVEGGRKTILANFSSKYDVIEDQIKKGKFDTLILSGDFDEINTLVKSNL